MRFCLLGLMLLLFSNTLGATFKLARALDARAAQITAQLAEQ